MIRKNPTFYKWVFEEHFADLQDYLYNWVEESSRGDLDYPENSEQGTVLREFIDDPHLGFTVLNDWVTNRDHPTIDDPKSNIHKLINYILKPEVFVILILGMPGSGKTTTAYKIAELLKSRYSIKQVAPMIEDGVLPDWIGWITDVSKAESGDFVLVDEAGMQDSARQSSSRQNQEDTTWLAVGRHIGCKIGYMSQLSSIADLNFTRWSNVIISKGYNTSAVGASEIERKHIAENPIFQYLKPAANYAGISSDEKDWCVVTMHGQTFMCCLKKPYFMNDKLSKPYRRFIEQIMTPEISARLAQITDEQEKQAKKDALIENIAMQWATFMRNDGKSAATIKIQLDTRGYRRPLKYWKIFTGEEKAPRS